MNAEKSLYAVLWCLLLFAATADVAAQTITLEASADVWIREADPGRTFEGDLMSVWSAAGNDGARRYGVVEFDVSGLAGIPIEGATLRLWAGENGFSDDAKPIKQSAVAIDTSGGTQTADMTWDAYMGEYAAGAAAMNGLGLVDFAPAGVGNLDRFVESHAEEADLDVIEAAANGSGLLTLVMIADEDGTDYAKSWGDGPDGFAGLNAQLVVGVPAEFAPAPGLNGWGMALLSGSLLLGGLVLLRRRAAVSPS